MYEWTKFGNTLRYGPEPNDFAIFPGDHEGISGLIAAHKAELAAQIEQNLAIGRDLADAGALIDRLRAALLDAQGALEDFGAHEEGCEWRPHMDAELDCTCGLVDAKARARNALHL